MISCPVISQSTHQEHIESVKGWVGGMMDQQDPQLEKEVKVSFLISRQRHLCPKQEPWLNRGPWIILMVYPYCWTVWSVTHTLTERRLAELGLSRIFWGVVLLKFWLMIVCKSESKRIQKYIIMFCKSQHVNALLTLLLWMQRAKLTFRDLTSKL